MDKKCFWSMMALPSLLLAGSLIRPVETGLIDSELGDPDTWQAFFDREIPEQLGERQIAGAVVAVVEGEKLAFAKGYGFAEIEHREAVRPDATLFRIGSITKLFTWTAVMQLVEQGKLDLDADVNTYLDFRIPDSFREPVTLRHLMTHSAGFEDSILGVQAVSAQGSIADGEWLESHMPARVSAPGEVSSYSNYGAALAGYIVERVSGITYENYLKTNIFVPLGMNRTTVRQPVPDDWANDLSMGFLFSESGFAEQDFEYFTLPSMGGATSTAADMARFMSAHLQNGRYGSVRILQSESAQRMHTRAFASDPRINGWAYGFYELNQNRLEIIGHAGDTRFFHSLLAIIPGKNLGIFVAYNSENAFDVPSLLLRDFLDQFFPVPVLPVEKKILFTDDLARVAGSYRQNSRFSFSTMEKALSLFEPIIVQPTEDGAILVSSASLGQYRFIPIEPLAFAQEDDPENILIFRKDGDGNVTSVFLKNDPTIVFEKLPWYSDFTLHYGILIAAVLLFLTTLCIAVVRWMIRRIHKRKNPLPPSAQTGWRILTALSMVGILFPIGFIFSIGGIAYGEVGFLNLVLALPVIFLALTLAGVCFTIYAWQTKTSSLAERIYFAVTVLTAMAYIWSLNTWNLIGWKY